MATVMTAVTLSPGFRSLRDLRHAVDDGAEIVASEVVGMGLYNRTAIPATDGSHMYFGRGYFAYVITKDGRVIKTGRKLSRKVTKADGSVATVTRRVSSSTRLGVQIGAGKGRLGKRGASATGPLARVIRKQVGPADVTSRKMPLRRNLAAPRGTMRGIVSGESWVLPRKRTGPDNLWRDGMLIGTQNNGGDRRR